MGYIQQKRFYLFSVLGGERIKTFLIKTSFFLLPLIILSLNYAFYETSGGDLTKIGRISIQKEYRNIFKDDLQKQIKYRDFSEIDLNGESSIQILTIGDSFSQQGNIGYQNYLSSLYNLNVVNIDIGKINNASPVQFLFSIVKGDVLDKLKVNYIILEFAEKSFAVNSRMIKLDKTLMFKDFNKKNLRKMKKGNSSLDLGIFKDMTCYFIFNILYKLDERAYISDAYKVKLTKKLFSTKKNELLFHVDDIKHNKFDSRESVKKLNEILNILSKKLNEKRVKLIVLPAPDKYDLYYGFIKNNHFPKNNFFNYLKEEEKEYIYINSKDLLLESVNNGEKDVYFADDTHWSPIASKIIAKNIYEEVIYMSK